MDDEIFNIDPDGLEESGNKLINEVKIIDEAIQDIIDARKLLSGWVSPNKEKYDAKVDTTMPRIQTMSDSIRLYGTVAINRALKARNSENQIANKIEEDLFSG